MLKNVLKNFSNSIKAKKIFFIKFLINLKKGNKQYTNKKMNYRLNYNFFKKNTVKCFYTTSFILLFYTTSIVFVVKKFFFCRLIISLKQLK